MAIVLCEMHSKNRADLAESGDEPVVYAGAVEAFGYPDTAAICLMAGCEGAGLIWLEQHELDALTAGQETFSGTAGFMKVKIAGTRLREEPS